jgi:hypothetical protein
MMVVFDLDGTLRNCDARVNEYLLDHELGYPHKRSGIDWDAFFLACADDLPIHHTLNVLRALHDAGATCWIWTGCSDVALAMTQEWCVLNGVPPEVISRLVMRKAGDRSDDATLKPSWIAEHGRPDLVFEDRNRVVAEWRGLGIPCYHVADGDF